MCAYVCVCEIVEVCGSGHFCNIISIASRSDVYQGDEGKEPPLVEPVFQAFLGSMLRDS